MAKGVSELERPGLNELTMDEFRAVLPPKVRKSMNVRLLKEINHTIGSPEEMEVFKENLLSYTRVMMEGRFKLSGYINAVKYVSFKLLGDTNISAYVKTFPDKYRRFLRQGTPKKDIASYATAFNKSKLVNLVYEQTLIPTHVLNAPLYQQALNTQAELMLTAKSEMVRTNAANSLLVQLKPPETKKIELDIGHKEDSAITLLRETTMALVTAQRKQIASGMNDAGEVAASKLIVKDVTEEVVDAECEEVG